MKLRLALIAGAALVALSLASAILARPPSSREALDTTGDATGGAVAGDASPSPDGFSAKATATLQPVPAAASGAPAASPGAAATPIAVGGIPLKGRGPLILLNPATVRPGSTVGIIGGGFDANATIDLVAKRDERDKGEPITFVQADKGGSFGGVNFTVPTSFSRGNFIVEARQRNSDKIARATGLVASTAASIKLGIQVGKPGEEVAFSAQGFAPDEELRVYWNAVAGEPVAVMRTDGGGAVRQADVRVPFGAVGLNTFIFVGEKSLAPVTMQFQLLSLFPVVTVSSYAIKADNEIRFSGKDFGPNERVLVYFNTPDGPPLGATQANADGTFTDVGGLVVPFGLKGQQTLVFVGEQSRAPATVTFDILSYTPNVQPSTYGGRPGTAVSFYAVGFARAEVVNVFVGRTRDNAGKLVSCFRTDDRGNAGAAGSYVIAGNAPAGPMQFTFVGGKSGATTTTSLEVAAAEFPVQIPEPPAFTCTLAQDATGGANAGATQAPTAAPASTPAPTAPVAAQTYTVAAGESLASIAVKLYGDADLWRRIYDANKDVIGSDPSALRSGMALKIPPKQ